MNTSLKDRLARVFKDSDIDAIVLANACGTDSNFLYLTGFTSGVFEGNILIATRRGTTLLTDTLEYDTAVAQKPKEMRIIGIGMGTAKHKRMRDYLKAELEGKVVGMNFSSLPHSYYRAIKKLSGARKVANASKMLSNARVIKDNGEIARMRKAVSFVKATLRSADEMFRTGMTELELAAEFDYSMRKRGADGTSFNTIVSFGKNAALPHHSPDNTRLKPNDIVLIDAGAKYKNYSSDMTRTFYFKPQKSSVKYKRYAGIRDTVLKAQQLALENIYPGAIASKAHIAAADYINGADNGRYKNRFTHSLGHSIGIDVHDGRFGLAESMHFRLREGMIFSDEPGIYIVGFGGVRIEDDVLVTKKGGAFL